MVTKQQQLEWLAKNISKFPDGMHKVFASVYCVGIFVGFLAEEKHEITLQEWQQERNKISSKPEVDNSWYERGEFPPVGCECEFCNSDDEWADWLHSVFVGFDSTGNGVVSVFGDDKGVLWISNNSSDFRPLRTEREKAIDEMVDILKAKFDLHGVGSVAVVNIVDELYDAGYRKVKP